MTNSEETPPAKSEKPKECLANHPGFLHFMERYQPTDQPTAATELLTTVKIMEAIDNICPCNYTFTDLFTELKTRGFKPLPDMPPSEFYWMLEPVL